MISAVSPINQTFTGAKASMIKAAPNKAQIVLQKEVKDLSQHLRKICSLKSELNARITSKTEALQYAKEPKFAEQLKQEIAEHKTQVKKLDTESDYYISSINRVRSELTKFGV